MVEDFRSPAVISFKKHVQNLNILQRKIYPVGNIMYEANTVIGLDNGLSPDRRQVIIWTNAGLLLIEPLGTNFNEI